MLNSFHSSIHLSKYICFLFFRSNLQTILSAPVRSFASAFLWCIWTHLHAKWRGEPTKPPTHLSQLIEEWCHTPDDRSIEPPIAITTNRHHRPSTPHKWHCNPTQGTARSHHTKTIYHIETAAVARGEDDGGRPRQQRRRPRGRWTRRWRERTSVVKAVVAAAASVNNITNTISRSNGIP